ncbi:hypothetical protein ACA910_020980 [Epithemia clementina (nom. ined.)]
MARRGRLSTAAHLFYTVAMNSKQKAQHALSKTYTIMISKTKCRRSLSYSPYSSASQGLILLVLMLATLFGGDTNTTGALSLRPNPQQTTARGAGARRTVLVTGGAGYIGSHTCLELLLTNQYKVVVVDNLDNSSQESLRRVQALVAAAKETAGATAQADENEESGNGDEKSSIEDLLEFRSCDIRDTETMERVMQEFPDISSCVHFAGLKAVGESVANPLAYYDCNVGGTVQLLHMLQRYKVSKFVFSSSATVYGDPEQLPVTESARLQATNPYGRTKLFIEEILRDLHASNPSAWNILILRYFNPIGAHPSGQIGEDPQGIPNNLMPFIAQVCVGRREKLSVFGDDYDTPDGTGVRDYIHVVDLAKGHVAALNHLYQQDDAVDATTSMATGSCQAVNLGTGRGVSVLELVKGMSEATGKPVPYEIAKRRPGDVASVYADPSLAESLLQWKAELGVQAMCDDTWNWQKNNPYGYQQPEQQQDKEKEQATAAEVKQ